MKRVVNKLENSKFEVLCTIEENEWKALQEKAFKALAKNVQAKGFRKGHVPEDMARKMVNQGEIINKAVNDAIQPAFNEVLKEEKLQPFAQPTVDVTKVSDTELGLKFVIIVRPEVTLGEYKGLAVEKATPEVSEEEVNKSLEALVAQNASLNVVEREAKLGDTVVLDFVGSVGGVEFDGGKAENYSLELGSNSFVPGFEDQLVGTKSGDVKDVVVTFPTQYVPELAGKEATFKCTIHEVKEKVLPEFNKEFFEDPQIKETKLELVQTTVDKGVDEWIQTLGFVHDRENKKYIAKDVKEKEVIIFAHQGISTFILSSLLDMSFPKFMENRKLLDCASISIVNIDEKTGKSTLEAYNDIKY